MAESIGSKLSACKTSFTNETQKASSFSAVAPVSDGSCFMLPERGITDFLFAFCSGHLMMTRGEMRITVIGTATHSVCKPRIRKRTENPLQEKACPKSLPRWRKPRPGLEEHLSTSSMPSHLQQQVQ